MKIVTRILFAVFLLSVLSELPAQTPGQWVWMKGSNVTNNPGTYGTMNVASPANQPPALYEACSWRDPSGNFWLFGGGQNGSAYNAMWKYDLSTGNWTWVGGSNLTNQPGIYGTQGIAAPTNWPGGRGWGTMTWVDMQGNFWLYGGYGYDATGIFGPMNDLWKFDLSIMQWTWMKGSTSSSPPAVFGTKGVAAPANVPSGIMENHLCWADNSNHLWFYGGYNSNFTQMDDIWKYDIATNMWTWVNGSGNGSYANVYGPVNTEGPSYHPGGRFGYTSFIHPSGNLYLFGASGYNDVWRFNPSTGNWAWMGGTQNMNDPGSEIQKCDTLSTNYPGGLSEMRATWADSCGFWVFGGYDGNQGMSYNNLWYYNSDNQKFVWVTGSNTPNDPGSYGTVTVSAASNQPPSRNGAVTWNDLSGNLWMFGGEEDFGLSICYNDLWRFTPDPACVPLCSQSIFNTGINANFTGSGSGCAPLSVTFNNSFSNGQTYLWDFGDGTTSSSQDPTHIYNNAGNYSISLIVTDSTGADTVIHVSAVHVGAVPTAAFTENTDTICTGQTINFTNNSSGPGGVNNIHWTFGDGGTSTQNNPTHTYNSASVFSVMLTVQDTSGYCTDTLVQNVVALPWPNMSVSAVPLTGCEPLPVAFSSAGSTNSVSFNWTFGDGSSSAQQNPAHTYQNNGTYPVALVGQNIIGCKDTAFTTVTVYPQATAGFTANPLIGCTPFPVSFQNTSTNFTNLLWTFLDDTTTCTDTLCTHIYGTPGTQPVKLIAYGQNGCNDTLVTTISITKDCEEIHIPNVFTPNGDGDNDFFTVLTEGYASYEIEIYDRWGLKMFESTNNQVHWNGNKLNSGGKCPDGTYYYIINVKSVSGTEKNFKGYLGLYR